MKVEKSVELESYNWTNLRIKVWQSIDLDQSIQALKHSGLPLQRMCKIFCKGSWSCDSSIKSTWQTSLFLRGVSGKLHWERQAQRPHKKAQQEEGNSQKIHMCSSCPYETPYKHMFILPLRNTMQTVPLQTTNYKQGQTTNNKQWKMRNNDKKQTTTSDKQWPMTNNKCWQTKLFSECISQKLITFFFLKPNVLSNMSKPSRSDFRSVDKDNIIGQKVSLYIFCPRVNGTTRYDLVRVMTNLGLALEGWSKIARLHQLLYDILPSNELTPNINLGVGGPADHLDT